MWLKIGVRLVLGNFLLLAAAFAQAEPLKPFILGNAPPGDMNTAVAWVKTTLAANGFQIVGSYAPYPTATVIAAINSELKVAALKAKNGAFGAAQRVAVTEVDGKLQLSYVNPLYLGTAYGLGKLEKTSEALKTALGRKMEFGSEGVEADKLKPGVYRYSLGMPYFTHLDVFAEYPDQETAVAAVEKNLAAGKGGTVKAYRVDLAKNVSVFGVGITTGDGVDRGSKDTDKEIMDIIDFQDPRSTAYLPYELMVMDGKVVSLRGRYRIAVMFPDLTMIGKNSFSRIMSAPGGIKNALEAVAKAE